MRITKIVIVPNSRSECCFRSIVKRVA